MNFWQAWSMDTVKNTKTFRVSVSQKTEGAPISLTFWWGSYRWMLSSFILFLTNTVDNLFSFGLSILMSFLYPQFPRDYYLGSWWLKREHGYRILVASSKSVRIFAYLPNSHKAHLTLWVKMWVWPAQRRTGVLASGGEGGNFLHFLLDFSIAFSITTVLRRLRWKTSNISSIFYATIAPNVVLFPELSPFPVLCPQKLNSKEAVSSSRTDKQRPDHLLWFTMWRLFLLICRLMDAKDE